MKKWLCFLLAALLLVLGAGCGSAETDGGDTTPDIQPLPNLKVEDCYTYTENANGTYTYAVKGRSGLYIHEVRNSDRPAYFAVANEDVLIVYGQAGTGAATRWARFCNIQTGEISDTFGAYLAAFNNRVAFVERRTDAYHVFVCDPFAPNAYDGVYTLEGLTVAEGGDPIADFVLSAKGVLSVTYAAEGGHKTIEIDLLPAEDM